MNYKINTNVFKIKRIENIRATAIAPLRVNPSSTVVFKNGEASLTTAPAVSTFTHVNYNRYPVHKL